MWIQELNIKNFGKFADKKIELGPGINLIYGENESGKSTLHAFIRGCFYGMRKMRGRASKTDTYSRYQPWENPSYYAGVMRFVCGGKVFRLERDFTKGVQAGMLVCETDGERLSLENGDLEMLLGNVGEVVFDNTVSIGQLKNETDEGLVAELKNYMANLEGTGHSAIDVEKALMLLKDKKKQLEKQITAVKKQDEEKIAQIQARIQFLIEEQEKEQKEQDKVREQINALECIAKEQDEQGADGQNTDEKDIMGSERESEEKRPGLFKRFFLWLKRIFARLFGRKTDLDDGRSVRGGNKTTTGGTSVQDTEKSWTDNRNPKDYVDEKSKLFGKKEHLENQISEKKILIENARQEILLQEELYHETVSGSLREEINACTLAMERIQQVVSQLQVDVGAFLKKRTSEIFSEITDGKYQWVEVSEDLTLGVHGKDHFIPVEQLSRGTIWQMYFALRMAANEVLGQEEDLPVILDDAFVMYDDVRLGQVMNWLARQKKQVLIFSCQKREREWLMRAGITFHEVALV